MTETNSRDLFPGAVRVAMRFVIVWLLCDDNSTIIIVAVVIGHSSLLVVVVVLVRGNICVRQIYYSVGGIIIYLQ
jgi:hypothetical protein